MTPNAILPVLSGGAVALAWISRRSSTGCGGAR